MTVLHIHPDSTSLEFQMNVTAFSKFVEFIKLLTIDVYGKLNDNLLEQMRKKAQLLGKDTVVGARIPSRVRLARSSLSTDVRHL